MNRIDRIELMMDVTTILRYLQNKSVQDISLLFSREVRNIHDRSLAEIITPFGGKVARDRLLRGILYRFEGYEG